MVKRVLVLALALVAVLVLALPVFAGTSELTELRNATRQYRDVNQALADGYEPFLDCFDNPGVGGMGYHYVNFDIVDLNVEALRPEAIVYAPRVNGTLEMGAVEYIVPAQAWDDAGNTVLPSLYGQSFHLNEALGVYVLHVWVWRDNPLGIFEDWNPRVRCT